MKGAPMNVIILNWKPSTGKTGGPWAQLCAEEETPETMQADLDDSYGGPELCEEQVIAHIRIDDDRYEGVLRGLAALALSSEDLYLAFEHLLTRVYADGLAARKE